MTVKNEHQSNGHANGANGHAPNAPLAIVGRAAPIFSARSTVGPITLSDFQGQWVLLFFHPADFTPVCTTEFIAIAKRQPEFDALNVQLIGVSVDSVYAHLAWISWMQEKFEQSVDFPLVEDISMNIARAYGLIDQTSQSTEGVRACCFVNPQGVVKALIHYPMQIGRSIDEIMRVQQALITVEETGHTCPVEWNAGDPLMAYPKEDVQAIQGSWLEEAIKEFRQK